MSAQTTSTASEPLVPLGQLVRERIPTGTPSTSTLDRWRRVGVRGVKLGAIRVGARWFIRPSAFDAFVAAMNGDRPAPSAARRAGVVDRELDAIGI